MKSIYRVIMIIIIQHSTPKLIPFFRLYEKSDCKCFTFHKAIGPVPVPVPYFMSGLRGKYGLHSSSSFVLL